MGPKLLRAFAYVWFTLAGGLIVLSCGAISYTEGFAKVQEIFSPFNLWNFAAVVITLGPGIGARMLAEKLEERSARSPASRTTEETQS